MTILAGIDIGGTKSAVSLYRGNADQADQMESLAHGRFPTPKGPTETLAAVIKALDGLIAETMVRPDAVGISCGGPLDADAGIVLSPPNLPGWHHVDVVAPLAAHFSVPVRLENDANAGALAEWYWGSGRGLKNLIFLTFGTGMGAGLILNGMLYPGTTGLAGEIGHWRLADEGPVGFGKPGSFEGFCSGGGIARMAQASLERWLQQGKATLLAPASQKVALSAQMVGEAAQQRDPLALEILTESGRRLGQALALLIDLLNPELIVLGSIYGRQRNILEPSALQIVQREAISQAYARCRIEPTGLGEAIGDLASVAVALSALKGLGAI